MVNMDDLRVLISAIVALIFVFAVAAKKLSRDENNNKGGK